MVEHKIMLHSVDDVKNFAALACTKKYDVDLTSGRYRINAKSIMGILSLDLTVPINVVAHGEDDDFLALIAEYLYIDPMEQQ